jgi:hypothetical protein
MARPEGPTHHAGPSGLGCFAVERYPDLTVGAISCRPFGPRDYAVAAAPATDSVYHAGSGLGYWVVDLQPDLTVGQMLWRQSPERNYMILV